MNKTIEHPALKRLIALLRKQKQGKIWDALADLLEKPSRKKHSVSFARLNKVTKAGDTVVLASKLLSTGSLNHALTIACFDYSQEALKKKPDLMKIDELVAKNPSGSKVRIIV